MRVSKGRWRLSFIVPVLLLQCRGAKTGEFREVPLLYVPDNDTPLLIGSNGGRDRDPAWCHNLRHDPEVSCALNGCVRRYRAEELSERERTGAWQLALDLYPGYARYARRSGRVIPLFRLFPLFPLEP